MANRINQIVKNNVSVDMLPDQVVNNRHIASSENFSASKSRGTKIHQRDNGYKIVAWQKLLVKFQNMDQYQPMPVTILLDKDFTIQDVKLDPRTVGSQGLTCSTKYLQRNLNKTIGLKFNLENTSEFLSSKLHCFHLQELFLGSLSFMELFKCQKESEYDEVETSELIREGVDFHSKTSQMYSDGYGLDYQINFYKILKNITYGIDGYLQKIENVDVDFIFDGSVIFSTRLNADTNKACNIELYKLTFQIWEFLARQTQLEKTVEFCHSCSYPFTMIGLIVLGMAATLYSNNYNYVINVVRSCQRPNNKPVCVGVINDMDEARKLFPEFSLTDMY